MKTPGEISKQKAALLDKWLNRKKKPQSSGSAIQKLPAGTPVALSAGQLRLWFLQQLFPGNPFYHYVSKCHLHGHLREDLLRTSLEKVVLNHSILRTTFHYRDGKVEQEVHSIPMFGWTFHDLRQMPAAERDESAHEIGVTRAREPFDLQQGPLLRVVVIRQEDAAWQLFLIMHHMITDKWSTNILIGEWSAVYAALDAGKPSPLTPSGLDYGDFAYWQSSNPPAAGSQTYWQRQLAGALPVLDLPYDRPRPVTPSYNGALHKEVLPASLTGELKALAIRTNSTMFVLLLACFKVLLYRYSRQGDLLIGTPITNRDHTELENLIGFFNDTILLRSFPKGELSFLNYLSQVKTTVMESFSHKDMPFDTLVKVLKPERYISTNPLFQVMFLYNEETHPVSFSPGVTISSSPLDYGVSKFDLTLYLEAKGDELNALFEYSTDLFEPATVARMMEHFRNLLQGIVTEPDLPLDRLPLLTDAERNRQLNEWNDTKTPVPDVPSVLTLIENRAVEIPAHPAVACMGQTITYQELNEQANILAGKLLSRNIRPGTAIGLCARPSVEMIIGLLGILKAGGAYIPVDPSYPAERVEFILEDAKAALLLTTGEPETELRFDRALIQSIPSLLKSGPDPDSRFPTPSGDQTAYIIYTSGSTGQPKGVVVTHENLLYSTAARFSFYPEPPDNFLLLSSFAFDSSIAGIFWTLCSGGRLVLPEKRVEQDMDKLAGLIHRSDITHTLLLPSLYDLLLRYGAYEKLVTLQAVIVAGEACPASMVKRHFSQLPATALYNEYGPTEATVWCIAHQVTPADENGRVPIGRPVDNVRVYILDPSLQPVPVGVKGELFIGGKGVARGYVNRDDLTRERFPEDPFAAEPGARMYKTGDLASYRKDGIIDFHGRVDRQVKIRGHRVEPEEIRNALQNISGVMEAAVVVQPGSNSRQEVAPDSVNHLFEILGQLDEVEVEKLLRTVEQAGEMENGQIQ